MKKVFLILLVLAGCARDSAKTAEAPLVGPAEFESLIQPEAILLDVRTPEEFQRGYIEGAINLNYKAGDFAERIDSLDRSKTYLVYCASGVRSGKASNMMKEKGFTSVTLLDGGIQAWMEADRPIKK